MKFKVPTLRALALAVRDRKLTTRQKVGLIEGRSEGLPGPLRETMFPDLRQPASAGSVDTELPKLLFGTLL